MLFNKQTFLDRFIKLRKECAITQVKLAQILNVSKGAIAHWEKGSRFPSLETINELAGIFNCTPAYLLGLSHLRNFNHNDSYSLFHDLFYNSSTPLYLNVYDDHNKPQFIDVNNATLNILGYTKEEFLNLNPRILCDEVYCDFIPQQKRELHMNRKLTVGWIHITKDKKRLPVELDIHKFTSNGKDIYLTIAKYFND
ncbi:MAG: helix-turn-helix domain-containing protein [Peptococcaceae bacterium]